MAWWAGQPSYGSNPVSKYIRENFAYLKPYVDYIINSGVTQADLAGLHAPGSGAISGIEIYPETWGAVGDGVHDDSAAIRSAVAYLNTIGRGKLVFSRGQYRVFSDGVTTTLGAFVNMNGIEIAFEGSELVVDRTFALNQTVYCFTFVNCTQINFQTPRARCTQTQPVNQKTDRGAYFADFTQGCNGVVSDVAHFDSLRGGWNFHRLSTDPTTFVCRNIDLGITYAVDTGYPLVGSCSGYDLAASLRTLRCGRSYFFTGFYNHKINVFSANHEASADCLIATDAGLGADGLDLDYTNIESTGVDNSLACVVVEYQDSDIVPGSHRNIHVKLNIQTSVAAWLGLGFQVWKTLFAGGADPVDRGHVLENISLSGSIDGGANQRSIGICNVGTWGAGEYVSNIRIKDLRLVTGQQPTINLASLKDVAVLDNVYSSTQMNIYGNLVSKIVCIGVESLGSLTDLTTNTAHVDYISCTIGATANQSIINKTFTNTYLGAYLTNSCGVAAGKEFFPTVPIGSIAYGAMGTDVTHVNGTIYTAEIYVDHDVTITGVRLLNGATVGTDERIVALLDWHGTVLANSALAGTTSAGANAFQVIPFTAPVVIQRGRYFISVQANGAADGIRCVAANTFMLRTRSEVGVFGTLAGITAPTTFVADVGPIAVAYE